MSEREIVVAPLGLITKPNKIGQYPAGALLTAQNVCMRSPGVVEPLPARSAYATNGGGSDGVARVWSRKDSILVHTGSTGMFDVTASVRTAITTPTLWTLNSNPRFMRAKQRDFVTTNGGPVWLDGFTGRAVGLAPPASINATSFTVAATDQALANNTNANYRVIFTRQTATGLLSSAPSNILNIRNTSGSTAAPNIRARLLTVGAHQVGDVMEVYRTATQATGTDPGNRFRLCGSHTFDAGDIAALSVTVTDNCADASLGADLYCNPGQPSQSARHNRCPSLAYDLATFKGYAVYVTPYSHVRGKFKILGRVGALGVTSTVRTHGIGVRTAQGDFTNTSPTVLNVTNVVGLKIGQSLAENANIPANTTIANLVGTTITMSNNAIGTAGASLFASYDRFEIQGVRYDFASLEGLADALALGDTGLIMRTDAYLRQTLDSSLVVVNNGADDNATILFEDVFYPTQGSSALNFRATNGQNYSPTLNSFTGAVYTHLLAPNYARLTVSKLDQPDHVPEENELVIGSGYIHRLIPTKDTLFAFCSDGLYAIEGDGGVFRVRLVDETLRLATRSSVDVMSDMLWAYTNRGFVSIGGNGVDREISTLTIGDLIPGAAITTTNDDPGASHTRTFVTCDERNREARLCIRASSTSTIYVYNVATDKFTTIVDSSSGSEVVAECYAPYLESIVWSPSVTAPNTPLYRYATDGTTRSDGAVAFQHIYGDKQPFTLKQWSDFEFLFRNVGGAMTLDMKVNATDAFSAVAGTLHNDARHYIAGMPLNHAMAPSASFGFTTLSQGGSGWQLVGLGARWVPISKQVHK
jgi:hypothetical protein